MSQEQLPTGRPNIANRMTQERWTAVRELPVVGGAVSSLIGACPPVLFPNPLDIMASVCDRQCPFVTPKSYADKHSIEVQDAATTPGNLDAVAAPALSASCLGYRFHSPEPPPISLNQMA